MAFVELTEWLTTIRDWRVSSYPCGDGMTNFQGISAMVFLIVNCAHDKVIIVGDMCVMESSRKRMIMNDNGGAGC